MGGVGGVELKALDVVVGLVELVLKLAHLFLKLMFVSPLFLQLRRKVLGLHLVDATLPLH